MEIGYPEAIASLLADLDPAALMACLPIQGNAFSDGPLLRAIDAVMTDPKLPLAVKRLAIVKGYLVVGMEPPKDLTPQQIMEEVKHHLNPDKSYS